MTRQLSPLLFVAPLGLCISVVVVGPAIATVVFSFTDWNGLSSPNWVGLDNYTALIQDEDFLSTLQHNLFYIGFFVTVPVAMALVGAFMLSRIRRLQLFFRTAYFLPYIFASVVNGAIWQFLLSPDLGLAQQLGQFGIHALDDVYFLGDESLSLASVAFVDNWQWWGFLLVLFMAAMQSVDTHLYEAARVDGAGPWQEFRHITLPSIQPTIALVLVVTVIWSFLAFDYAFVLTSGGPAGSSMLMSILLNRHAFVLNEAGYAAAMGIVMTGLTVGVIGVYAILRRRGWEI